MKKYIQIDNGFALQDFPNCCNLELIINWGRILEIPNDPSLSHRIMWDLFSDSTMIAYSEYNDDSYNEKTEAVCHLINGRYVILNNRKYNSLLYESAHNNSKYFENPKILLTKIADTALVFENLEQVMNYLLNYKGISGNSSINPCGIKMSYQLLFFEIIRIKKHKWKFILSK